MRHKVDRDAGADAAATSSILAPLAADTSGPPSGLQARLFVPDNQAEDLAARALGGARAAADRHHARRHQFDVASRRAPPPASLAGK
jgi:hypothetical protein